MINGFYTAGVTTVKDGGTWVVSNTATEGYPVCLACASTKDSYKVEISEDAGGPFRTWTTIADLNSDSGDTVMDWMFYVTKKGDEIKTTGTGFMRVQGTLVAKV